MDYNEQISTKIHKFIWDNDKMVYNDCSKEMKDFNLGQQIWGFIDENTWGVGRVIIERPCAQILQRSVNNELL